MSKVWICLECGREYNALPFPSNCLCGNYCEDYFREKDIYDEADDKAGRPLTMVKYDAHVLSERNEQLKQGSRVILKIAGGKADTDTDMGTGTGDDIIDNTDNTDIDYNSMTRKQLFEVLSSRGESAPQNTVREKLLELCNV